ncbi:MAG: hypothetical protein KDK45_01145 [Leptospiraceae bacterium]|nr:hypothetical protein [Leptospiraceae bacterium]
MLKRIFKLLLLIFILSYCSDKAKKEITNPFLFSDGFDYSKPLQFFNLLDPFPVLKKGLSSVDVNGFNTELDKALRKIHPKDISGSLRALQFTLLSARSELQNTLTHTASLLERARTVDPVSYNALSPMMERLRNYSKPVIRGLLPISAAHLINEYNTKSSATIQKQFNDFATELESKNTKDLLIKAEDIAHKGLSTNKNVRSGLETLLNGLVHSTIITDKSIKSDLISMMGDLGEVTQKKAGFSDSKSPETVFKELIINLEDYNTIGGANYTSEYSNASHSSEFETLLVDLFKEVRKLIIPDTSVMKNSVILTDELAKTLALMSFTSTLTGVEDSLKDLIRLDIKGKDRSYSNNGSLKTSALETLFFMLSIVDSFGYVWDTTDNCNNSATCNNYITGATGGEMTVGDTLWSLQSVLRSADTFNFKNILKLNAESRNVFKNNIELSTTAGTEVNINTRVLRLLETESIGSTKPITEAATDPVYAKTTPWVMNWVKRVLFEGYGPYYNKNKKNANGDNVALNGETLKYKSTWKTGDYKICLEKDASVALADRYRWVGLGGRESDGTTIAHPTGACTTFPTPPTSSSWTYTIQEITKTDSERAVDSDEEALYKNFQWLLYEKRFVVIIPTRAKLSSTVPFEEGLFIIAIGNGLKGMMGLKPNCGPNNSLTDCGDYNGVWNSDTSTAKTLRLKQYNALNTDLATFSSVPGDSVLLIEGWGYGSSGISSSLTTSLVLPSLVFNLLVPSPSLVFGMIPPVLSQNFDVLERLSFLTSDVVKPADTANYWEKRNKLLPLIAGLAKVLDDQVDVANSKNPFTLLVGLSKVLARPNIFSTPDPVSSGNLSLPVANPAPPTIPSVRIKMSSTSYGIRTPNALISDYYPNDTLRPVISLLSENERKYQDGLLNLLSKTDLLTKLINAFAKLGASDKKEGRDLIISGIQTIVKEIKVSSDSPTVEQYNLQTYINEKAVELAAYPDSRSTDTTDASWNGVNDSVQFVRDYFGTSSPYSLIKSADFAIDMISEIPPSSEEIKHLLNVAATLFVNTDGTRPYQLTDILTKQLSPLIRQIAPYGRNIFAMMGSLGEPGSYISFLETQMTIGTFKIVDLLSDTERLLKSNMIQTKTEDGDSLLYSSGVLLKAFADINEFGKKLDTKGFPFADSLNKNDDDTYWQRLNIILSEK